MSELARLRAHLRARHPSLLGDVSYLDDQPSWMAAKPLPRAGLDAVPDGVILAVHEANHQPVYADHHPDDWRAE